MGRAPCCDKANVKKGPWSPEEDAALKSYIETNGTGGNWIALPQKIGLKRCGKSCRLRWLNYLRPNIKHGGFTEEEDNIICSLYISIGSRWSIIAAQLPGRTDNDIKNYWNTRLKKKLLGRRKQQSCSSKDTNGIATSVDDNNSCSSNNALSSSAMERLQLHMQLQSLQSPFSCNNSALWPNKLHPFQEKIIHQTLIHQSHNNNNSNNPIMMMMMQNNNNNNNEAAGTIKIKTPKVVAAADDLAALVKEKQNNPMMNNHGSVSFIGSENNVPMQSCDSSNVIAPMRGDDGTVGMIQQVCALQTELDDILNNTTSSLDNYIPQVVAAEFDCFREINNNNNNNNNSNSSSKDSLIWWSNDSGDTKSASSNSWDSSTTTPVLLPEGMMFQDYDLGYTL